mmetsp:Transcript_28777/g.65208  ORF Transcript_28777/g.65208 Transcript_28777/m.65208 type:complete len:282 (+) Transcript_28777:230-1075(+)
MQERLAAKHSSELLRNTLEHLLDGSRVTDEVDSHLQSLGRNVANRRLDIVGNPLDEIGRVFVLDVEHLLINFLGRHTTTEHSSTCQVAPVSGISSAHHVLSVKHLLRKLGNCKCTVLLRSTAGERSKSNHEKVKTWEGNNVHSKLSQIRVELARETERTSNSRHHSRNQMVQVSKCRRRQLQSSEANIVQGLIVDAEALVGVLNKLMDREGSVVGLDDSIRHLRRRHDGEGEHDTIRVLFTDLGNEKRAHASTSSTSEGVRNLETLEAIARLGLLANHIED